MRRNPFIIAGALVLAVAALMLFTGFGFAQANGPDEGGYRYGETSDGAGPDLENSWGPGAGSRQEALGVAAGDGDCICDGPVGPLMTGHGEGGHGEPSDGEGPDLYNHWGWPDD